MASALAHVSPAVLEWARRSIGYSVEQAAEKAKVAVERLELAEAGGQLLTMRQAERLAQAYERPLAALFLPEPLAEEPQEAQFRRLPGAPAPPWPPDLVALVRRVRERQDAAADLYGMLGEPPSWPAASELLRVPAAKASERTRELLGISFEEQASWRDRVGYTPLRQWIDAVEDLGVLVMQGGPVPVEEMRGFASLHDVAPAIILNSKDDPRARVFTLIHELGHLYLTLSSGESAGAEAWCDQFAGEVLMPPPHLARLVEELGHWDSLKRFDQIALIFGVTPRAAVVRARRQGLITAEEQTQLLRLISLRPIRDDSGGGDYYWNQIGRLGPAYSRLVFAALESQAVTYAAASSLLGGLKVNNFDTFRDYLERRATPA